MKLKHAAHTELITIFSILKEKNQRTHSAVLNLAEKCFLSVRKNQRKQVSIITTQHVLCVARLSQHT